MAVKSTLTNLAGISQFISEVLDNQGQVDLINRYSKSFEPNLPLITTS